jgi:hypothetical protein
MTLQSHFVKGEAMDVGAAQALLQSPEVKWCAPSIWLNALQLDSIASVFVDVGGRPLAGIRMTLPLAKTYVAALSQLVADYERKTGQTVPTLEELQAKLGEETAKG